MPFSVRPVAIAISPNGDPIIHPFLNLPTPEESPMPYNITPSPISIPPDLRRLILAYHTRHSDIIGKYALSAMGVDRYLQQHNGMHSRDSWFSSRGDQCLYVSLRPRENPGADLHQKLEFYDAQLVNMRGMSNTHLNSARRIIGPRYPCLPIIYRVETAASRDMHADHYLCLFSHQFSFPDPDESRPNDQWYSARMSKVQLLIILILCENL